MRLGTRITVLLVVLMACFSVTAQAYDLSSFRLRIEDPLTGIGRVLTDNVKLGFGNNAGDQDSLVGPSGTPGILFFSGFVENFNVTVMATSTVNPDGSAGLTLSARVTYNQASNATILITLEDTGYVAPAAPVLLIGTVGGYNPPTIPGTPGTVTPAGDLTGGAASVNVQSWLDVANIEPTFGNNSGSAVLNPLNQTIPPAGSNTTTAFAGGGQAFGTSTFAYAGAGVGVPLVSGQNYSMFSQASVTFSGIGTADFSLSASDPLAPSGGGNSVPEPTSLMLLGSALVGIGILRRKKQT